MAIANSPSKSALAFALRFHCRKRVYNADEIMSEIVARRLVEHLERDGFLVIKKQPAPGHAALGRGAHDSWRKANIA